MRVDREPVGERDELAEVFRRILERRYPGTRWTITKPPHTLADAAARETATDGEAVDDA